MLKRGISLFLALAMVFCTMPVETMAAEILTVNEFSGMEETTEPISTEELFFRYKKEQGQSSHAADSSFILPR